jgi:hypothetical protein
MATLSVLEFDDPHGVSNAPSSPDPKSVSMPRRDMLP